MHNFIVSLITMTQVLITIYNIVVKQFIIHRLYLKLFKNIIKKKNFLISKVNVLPSYGHFQVIFTIYPMQFMLKLNKLYKIGSLIYHCSYE